MNTTLNSVFITSINTIVKFVLILSLLTPVLANITIADQPQFDVFDQSIDNAASPIERVQLALVSGNWCFDNNFPVSAKRYYERAVTEGAQLEKNIFYAEALTKLAGLQENKFTARLQFNEAKAIYEKFENTQANVADILEKIIWTYDYLDRDSKKVIGFLEQAIQIRKKLPFSTKYTETLRVLAWLYESRNLLSQAEYYYSWAINEDIKNLTFNDIRTVLAMENFAQFFMDFSLYDKAEQLLKRKLKLHQSAEFADLYNMGRTESMLGWVNLQLKRYNQAENYYKNALEHVNSSFTRNPSKAHYYSLSALFDLIYLYASQSNYKAAAPYFETAKQLISEADESNFFEYIKSVESDQLLEEGIGGYSWAMNAHLIGIQLMLNHNILNLNP